MLTTHATAAVGFSQQAKTYAQLRPSYPLEALEQIKTLIPNPDAQITDLAAGIGKMTRLLLEHRYVNVTAVEPVDAMRDILVSLLPKVHTIKGSSWDIPLASQSQDAIIVAQAFHWFADIETLQEIYRVLKPNGYLTIVWNKEDQSRGQWVKQLHE
ncbi:S-adenosyl-L-methionine-dependent methyltransferase [Fennellomyces sp. T-0311]|nr:S-adenosyl-L-methionine-dependent methyltransferase [Fennellomyces sp. T-0311]